MPKNAIVLGMARSGTSLTASIFVGKGYFGGESLAPADHLNPIGYFEAEELVQRNSGLIQSTGYRYDNSWVYREPMTPSQLAQLRRLELGDSDRDFVERFTRRAPWVWKDPRMCLLLRAWWPLLDARSTAVLVVERERDAIFDSFVRAGWRETSRAERLETYERIAMHLDTARETIAELSIPALTIRYADFAADPSGTARRISAHFDVHIEADDIPYEQEFNHDSAKGRAGTRIDRLVTALPGPIRRMAKAVTPEKLLRALYPERYR